MTGLVGTSVVFDRDYDVRRRLTGVTQTSVSGANAVAPKHATREMVNRDRIFEQTGEPIITIPKPR